jgi:hypothetical protein
LPFAILQDVPHGEIEIEVIGRTVELLFRNFEWIEFFLKRLLGRHANLLLESVGLGERQ